MGRLGAEENYLKYWSFLNMRPNIRGASSIRLSCVYDVLVVAVVVRYKTIPTARRALLFIARAFFNDTITVAVRTGFHLAMLPHSRNYIPPCASLIRLLQRRSRVRSALLQVTEYARFVSFDTGLAVLKTPHQGITGSGPVPRRR